MTAAVLTVLCCSCPFVLRSGLFAIPTAAADGSCSDSNYLRYALGDTRSCTRSTGSVALSALCVSGGIFSGARYVANLQLGKTASAVPAQTAQYVAANITAVWQRAYAADGSGALLSSSATIPEPTWNAATLSCDNVLQSVDYLFTYLEGGSITTDPAPLVTAYLTSLPTSDGLITGRGSIIQTFTTTWQAVRHTLLSGFAFRVCICRHSLLLTLIRSCSCAGSSAVCTVLSRRSDNGRASQIGKSRLSSRSSRVERRCEIKGYPVSRQRCHDHHDCDGHRAGHARSDCFAKDGRGTLFHLATRSRAHSLVRSRRQILLLSLPDPVAARRALSRGSGSLLWKPVYFPGHLG